MPDVFISYKREEGEAVQIIADTLSDLKLEVWFDRRLKSGGTFDEEIAGALKAARAVLTCWTPAAMASEWVRGEATMAHADGRLVTCFLEPTELLPPFNLTHAENLAAWAGQRDDSAWLKVLERIGELVGRPGLATYHTAMRPDATVQELKAWVNANGDNPLAAVVWMRVATLEGEDPDGRRAREQQEARARDRERKQLAARSRQLARDRGLRDPRRERRRWLALAGTVAGVGLISGTGLVYVLDAQARERQLRDTANTPAAVRQFLSRNRWHPVAAQARQKLATLDSDAWREAAAAGSIDALRGYIADAEQTPQGLFLTQARAALREAERVKSVQEQLFRLRVYSGAAHGALDQPTRESIKRFRYRWLLPVSEVIDEALIERIGQALRARITPAVSDFTARTLAPPAEDDFMRIAERLGIDAAALGAVMDVEAPPVVPPSGRTGGRPSSSRATSSRGQEYRFDTSHPEVSPPRWDASHRRKDHAGRWQQFEEAFALDPDAAMKATTWGRFAILGLNHRTSGFETVGEFAHFLSESESNQYEAALLGFIGGRQLGDALRRHDWEGFARKYTGPGAAARRRASQLQEAYERRVAAVLRSGSRSGTVTPR